MTPRRYALVLLAVLLIVAGLFGLDAWKKRQGAAREHTAAVAEGEANAHVMQAQAIPDHAEALAQAKKDVAGARAEVERLRGIVAAERLARVPDPAVPPEAAGAPIVPDHRDEQLAADAVLITQLDRQVQELQLALADKTREANEWHAAHDARDRQARAQEAATEAWKQAVTTSRWRGRLEGFAVGAALGYVGGRRP